MSESEAVSTEFAKLEFLGRFASRPPLALKAPVILIGSGAGAQIRLKGGGVASAHALLICEKSGTYVRNLDGGVATLVNGRERRDAILADGDTLRVGGFEFRHRSGAAAGEGAAEAGEAYLEMREGQRRVDLRERVTVIGSREFCDEVLREEGILPVHVAVIRSGAGFVVRDLVTAPAEHAAVRVNGEAVRQRMLRDRDEIEIGPVGMRFVRREPARGGLRPVIGRRAKRIGSAVSALSPTIPAPVEVEPGSDELELAAPARRVPVALLLVLALACMAGAALAVWRLVPVEHVVEGSIVFERPAGAAEGAMKELLRQQELELLSEPVRRAAVRKLESRRADLGADLLARSAELGRRSWSRYEVSPQRAALVISVRGRDPSADAARLDALLEAFGERRGSDAGQDVSRLREELLASEVADLQKELDWRKRWAEQLRKDLKVLEADAPAGPQLERMEARLAGLGQSLEAAIEARVVAQEQVKELEPAPESAPPPPEQVEKLKQAQAMLGQARAREGKIRSEMADLEEQVRRGEAAARQFVDREQRLAELGGRVSELEKALGEKRGQLNRAQAEGSARLDGVAATPARVVASKDPRGFYMAGAVGVISVLFMLVSAALMRRGAARR